MRRALGTVYRDWGVDLDNVGRRRDAREKLTESLRLAPRISTLGDFGKTFVPEQLREWVRAARASKAAGMPRPL